MLKTMFLVSNQPSQQQLVDYTNAIITVNSYAYAVTNQSLPVLSYPPSNYGSFTENFASAKQHTLNWTQNIFPSMLQLPVTIKENVSDLFDLESTMIEAYLNKLILDPTNETAKKGLANALSTLQKSIDNQIKTVHTIQSSLSTFSGNLFDDAKILTDISQDALTDAGDDEKTINDIKQTIVDLNNSISNAQTILTISEVGIGVSLWVALIGVVVCLIPGAQGVGAGIIVTGVASEATSIAFTVIENQNIKDMQTAIDNKNKEIDSRHQDIILLNGVSTSFNNLYEANLNSQNALKIIEQMWTNLNNVIEEVKTELTDTSIDVDSANYSQALNDFQLAETNWNEVVEFSTALAGLNFNWQDSEGNWHNYSNSSPQANAGNVTQIPSEITGEVAA